MANLFSPGLLGGSKIEEKNEEESNLMFLFKDISSRFLELVIGPVKNKLAKISPMQCLSSWEITYLFTFVNVDLNVAGSISARPNSSKLKKEQFCSRKITVLLNTHLCLLACHF